ncbi:MAG: tail fiber domain-containing protein, partial [Bacteroidota bacterium]|nr:tail fiber domain-containing protein [Bacteroidota bacterium]
TAWVPWGIVDDGTTTTVTISPPNFVVSANNNAAIWNANRLQGYNVSSSAPSAGNILVWNNITNQWEPHPVTVAGAWSVNGNPGTNPALNFLGTTDDQPLVIKTDGTERMRVANSTYNGYVGIGDTDPAFRVELPNVGDPSGRGRANSWVTYSSMRWKDEIRPIENALDKVLRLRGYNFRWKPEYGGTEDIGFIAEEVAGVVPEVVSYEPDGQVGGMDYSRLVALLVEAMKQQQQEIAQLRGLVEQLLRERGSRGGETGSGAQIHDAWLGQNIPNPFEGTTTIPYYIPAGVGQAELVVRDRTGRELRRVELAERGAHGQVTLEMRLLGSGVYEYSLMLDGRVVATKQMTLVR